MGEILERVRQAISELPKFYKIVQVTNGFGNRWFFILFPSTQNKSYFLSDLIKSHYCSKGKLAKWADLAYGELVGIYDGSGYRDVESIENLDQVNWLSPSELAMLDEPPNNSSAAASEADSEGEGESEDSQEPTDTDPTNEDACEESCEEAELEAIEEAPVEELQELLPRKPNKDSNPPKGPKKKKSPPIKEDTLKGSPTEWSF